MGLLLKTNRRCAEQILLSKNNKIPQIHDTVSIQTGQRNGMFRIAAYRGEDSTDCVRIEKNDIVVLAFTDVFKNIVCKGIGDARWVSQEHDQGQHRVRIARVLIAFAVNDTRYPITT